MNTLQIQIFLDVAECGNFSQVARDKYISQPTVSKHIHNLESELGVQLFTRTKPSISLTPEGKIYQRVFLDFLDLLKDARDEVSQLSLLCGSLKIGLLSGWNVHDELMDAIDEFQVNHASDMDLVVENHSFRGLLSQLNQGNIDACIHLHDFLKKADNLNTIPLFEIPKYLIYSSRLDVPLSPVPCVSDFSGCTSFAIEENNKDMVKEQLIKYCHPYNIVPQVSVLPNIESVLNNVNRGKGVSIIDSYTGTRSYENINQIEIFPSHKIELAWIKNKKNKYISLFAEEILSILAERNSTINTK